MREIYVSRAGDPVHAGDKALTWDTPAQRGRVNKYGFHPPSKMAAVTKTRNFFILLLR